jgi:hypothetical protein
LWDSPRDVVQGVVRGGFSRFGLRPHAEQGDRTSRRQPTRPWGTFESRGDDGATSLRGVVLRVTVTRPGDVGSQGRSSRRACPSAAPGSRCAGSSARNWSAGTAHRTRCPPPLPSTPPPSPSPSRTPGLVRRLYPLAQPGQTAYLLLDHRSLLGADACRLLLPRPKIGAMVHLPQVPLSGLPRTPHPWL